MHVHSFLPIVGLTLVSTVAAIPHLTARNVSVGSTLPAKWSSLGCYSDSVSARGLQAAYTTSNDMTEAKCIEFCDDRQYSYAGVEYGQECRCDNVIHSPSVQIDESNCNFPCPGDSSEECGGSNAQNIFTNGVAPPVENPGVDGFHSLGCYTDSQTARTLSTYLPTSDGIVFVRGCIELCKSKGFTYCGVEYGQECYGGYGILNNAQPADPSTCNMRCNGNGTEECGGSSRINLYQSDSQPACAGPSGNSGLITNGGFENGLSPWTAKNNLGKSTSSVIQGLAYAGCSAFQIQTQPSSYTSQYQFGQTLSSPLQQGTKYIFTFYQGRRSSSASDGDSPDPVIAVASGSQLLAQGSACSGSACTLSGAGGSVYQQVQITFTAGGNQQTSLQFTVTYQNPGSYAPILFDEISIVPA